MVSEAKSDLLFEIIKRLRASNIPLAVPQKMVLENSGLALPDSISGEDK